MVGFVTACEEADVMNQSLAEKLALACRLLYMEGLVDHGGLVGARIPETGNLILNPREMRGTTGRHPGLIAAEDMVVVDPQGARVAGANNPPSETPIFTGVFAARPDVMAVFHLHLAYATLFSVVGKPLRPIGVTGAPFGDEVPVHADPTLIQRPEQGVALARSLGDRLAVILRGHGAVVVGPSLPVAVFRSVYLEMNAKLQAQAMAQGASVRFLDPEEAKRAEASLAGTLGRPWELWKRKALGK